MKPTSSLSTRHFFSVAAALLFFLFAMNLVHVARVYSATWDEAHHLYDGYTIWTRHDLRLNPEVPPLVKLVAALPLLPQQLYVPPDQHRGDPTEAFLGGHDFVFRNGPDRTLLPARMACMIFTLLLAGLIYFAAGRLFGSAAALIALTLFTFDPTVLANGTLVTTDLGSACTIFATIFALYCYLEKPRPQLLILAGVLAGLAMVTKFTGLLLAPMFLLIALSEAVYVRSFVLFVRRLGEITAVLLIAWFVIWATYGFRDAPGPNGSQLTPSLSAYIGSMPSAADARHLSYIARFHLLPQPYLWGLANTKKTEFEYISYFFGHIYRHGPWQYFPAAFLIKSTLPLLALLVAVPFLWRLVPKRTPRILTILLVPIVVYSAVITASHFDIGARHLLPLYPFFYLLAAAAAAVLLRRGWLGVGTVVFLLVWHITSSVRVAPAYMAYGNEAWGGPAQVHRYVSDANTDWGQQLKAVKFYLDQNHITECWFVYFADGAVLPSDYGIPCHRLPDATSLWWLNLPMEVPPIVSGTVLISDSNLEGVISGDGSLNPYDQFRGLTPVASIQYGVNVYQGTFSIPLASALVQARRSAELDRSGKPAEALAAARSAAALAPDSAIVQLNLADILAAHSLWSDALFHYEAADHLARTIRPDLQQEDPGPRIATGLAATRDHLPR